MGKEHSAPNDRLVNALTWREQDILYLLADRRTNREIAQTLGIELTTVKWYNTQIFSKLGVGNRYQAVVKAQEYGLLEEPPDPPVTGSSPAKSYLPTQLTSFVGRERAIAEVKRLLQEAHLLTLTGPAGTGKTRLALRLAAEVLDDFDDGVFFVDLAPINQPELVGDTIAQALGVMTVTEQPISRALENYLGSKKLLLLLDNLEHLLEAASLVGDLLSAAPGLKVLVTSREVLRLYGEQEYPVMPLGLPDLSNPDSVSALTDYEAVALFTQRAQAVKPDFTLTDEDAQAVAEICIRLDGLPLAIELAAARVKLFSPQALLGQSESRLATLHDGPRDLPERQRTLRGAIDWSYELLDDAKKTLFARLSVFQGGRTIEAVEAVCCHDVPIDALDGLASLLNKNLLRHEEGPDGEPRFSMLETIHEYGRERLQASGQAEDMHRRHAEYFTALAERAEPYTRGGPDQMRWLWRLEADHDNLRAAYTWSMQGGDVELGLRLVGALGYFWWRQGHYTEGHQWATRALDTVGSLDAPAPVRAALLDTAGVVAHYSHDQDTGKDMQREALALYRELGNKRDTGWVLMYLAVQSLGKPDEYEEAIAHVEEALALLRGVEDRTGIAQALTVVGELARHHGDLLYATKVFKEGLSIAREFGDVLRQVFILDSLGYIALRDDDVETAATLAHEALDLALEVGYKPHIPAALAGLAAVYMADGLPQHAARLLGAADALFSAHGFSPRPSDTPDIERTRATVLEMLGKVSFDTAWAEGQAMSLEGAIAYALDFSKSDE